MVIWLYAYLLVYLRSNLWEGLIGAFNKKKQKAEDFYCFEGVVYLFFLVASSLFKFLIFEVCLSSNSEGDNC